VANGTDALELAMRAVGVRNGQRVATVANAGFYTSTAVRAIGAVPFFLDVDLETRVVTLKEVERALLEKVSAVVVTHLYGQAVPEIDEMAALCRTSGVPLIEDCAQAHGASIKGQRVGSFGDMGCFSFYPTKNLGALGDGGAVVCQTTELAERVGRLRQYGWQSKYHVELEGARNSRLDEIQAAILSSFLPLLDGWNARRREIAAAYTRGIDHPAVMLPAIGGEDYVAHLYVVRTSRRTLLQKHLKDSGIASEVHYPVPDHRQAVLGDRFAALSLPHTEQLAQEALTLPCYPEMTDDDVRRVIAAIQAWSL
jgi:dTDP-4-amino-4,6-dideoxygalactose transaminase